jgi:hypothetical protein
MQLNLSGEPSTARDCLGGVNSSPASPCLKKEAPWNAIARSCPIGVWHNHATKGDRIENVSLSEAADGPQFKFQY